MIQTSGSLGPDSGPGLWEFACALLAPTLKGSEASSTQCFVMGQEAFDLFHEAGPELIDVPEIRIVMGLNGDPEMPIVSLKCVTLISLLSLDHA